MEQRPAAFANFIWILLDPFTWSTENQDVGNVAGDLASAQSFMNMFEDSLLYYAGTGIYDSLGLRTLFPVEYEHVESADTVDTG